MLVILIEYIYRGIVCVSINVVEAIEAVTERVVEDSIFCS